MKPKVSVIIPVYNGEKYIEAAVKSVLKQEYDNTEVIIINDGSTDGTVKLLKKLFNSYPQIILCDNQLTKGASGARNTGLIRASGKYIAFLDADDVWLPKHLESGIKFLEQYNEIDVICFNFDVMDYSNDEYLFNWFSERDMSQFIKIKEIYGGYYFIREDLFQFLIVDSFIHVQSMIIRSSIWNSTLFNENITHSEDRDFAIKMAVENKAKYAFKDIVTSIYYSRSNSLSKSSEINNSIDIANDHIVIYSYYLRNYDLKEYHIRTLKDNLYHRNLHSSYFNRKRAHFLEAFKSTVKSAKYKINVNQLIEIFKIVYFASLYRIKRKIS